MEWLIYLGKSATVLALFYLVYFFLLRKDTLFVTKRQFLVMGGIASICLPLVEFTKIVYVTVPEVTSIHVPETVPLTHIIQQNEAIAIYWWQIVAVFYVIGVLLMSFRFTRELLSLLRIVCRAPSERIGNSKHIKVNSNIAPFSFLNYIIYNPLLHSEEELKMILQHEQVHASQWHTIDILLANFILIFQWMNPFAWLFKNSIQENLEFIADNKTAEKVPSKRAYQMALVKASSTLTVPALTNNFYQSFIKKRIIMLNKSKSKKANVLKLTIILPLLAVFLWSFNVKEVVEYKTIASESIPSKILENPTIEPEITSETTNKAVVEAVNTSSDELLPDESEALMGNQTPAQQHQVKESNKIILDFRFTITASTTDAELEAIKKELKEEHNVKMTYSAKRNSNNMITSITINYSSDNGSGNYAISEDGPIEDFNFYMDEDGRSGFVSENAEEREEAREMQREQRMDHMVQRKEKMKERMEERKTEMEERRIAMKERMIEQKERLKEKEHILKKEHAHARTIHSDVEDEREHEEHTIRDSYRSGTYARSGSGSQHAIIIDKDTNDATLENMKTNLAQKGIDFSYSKVRRNSKGEITRIKIVVDNGKGSRSTTTTNTDDGEPIKDILIELK